MIVLNFNPTCDFLAHVYKGKRVLAKYTVCYSWNFTLAFMFGFLSCHICDQTLLTLDMAVIIRPTS